jgi:predicted protein tyrosine phosphatase
LILAGGVLIAVLFICGKSRDKAPLAEKTFPQRASLIEEIHVARVPNSEASRWAFI